MAGLSVSLTPEEWAFAPSLAIPQEAAAPCTGSLEYVPVVMNLWRMSLLLVARTSGEHGRPIRLASLCRLEHNYTFEVDLCVVGGNLPAC